jgi:hypothetical protein
MYNYLPSIFFFYVLYLANHLELSQISVLYYMQHSPTLYKSVVTAIMLLDLRQTHIGDFLEHLGFNLIIRCVLRIYVADL